MANYLAYKDAAARFGVSEWTIYSWVSRGLIHKYKRPLDRRVYVDVREIEEIRNATPTRAGDALPPAPGEFYSISPHRR